MAELLRILGCCSHYNLAHQNRQQKSTPSIKLDTTCMGHDVVIVKNGQRVCGTGGAMSTAPIVQNKAYFEVKLQQSGMWAFGVCTRECDVNTGPKGSETGSWLVCSSGIIVSSGEEMYRLGDVPQEGDIFGISYDHIELNFFLNGKPLNSPVTGIKGTVYPCVYIDDGAILDVVFETFNHDPPPGFDKIMLEKSLL